MSEVGVPAGRGGVHVWDRLLVGWHVAFGLFLLLAVAWLAVTAHLTGGQKAYGLALIVVLAVAYVPLVLRAPGGDPRESWTGTAYLVLAIVVTGLACALDVTMTMLLFVVFSHVWMFTPTRTRGALFAAALTVSACAGLLTQAGWSWAVAREVVPQLGVALGFSVLLGFWVARIIDQSKERADLIDQLEAARSDLAAAENARGALAEMGYVSVQSLAGGFDAWAAAGGAVAKPAPLNFD